MSFNTWDELYAQTEKQVSRRVDETKTAKALIHDALLTYSSSLFTERRSLFKDEDIHSIFTAGQNNGALTVFYLRSMAEGHMSKIFVPPVLNVSQLSECVRACVEMGQNLKRRSSCS